MLDIVTEIIKTRNFINVATCDKSGRPNGVSKLIVKVEGNTLVLVDYAVSRTYGNLKLNPFVSLSFFDVESLKGYQINGPVEIIAEGKKYEELTSHLTAKETSLATERVIRGMARGKPHSEFEMGRAKKFVFFKVRMDEIAEISYSGEIKREISPDGGERN
jgi:predicted pyridoxine 5'-phosphate oxidase superfamily flavin-nucleotide-binding protein